MFLAEGGDCNRAFNSSYVFNTLLPEGFIFNRSLIWKCFIILNVSKYRGPHRGPIIKSANIFCSLFSVLLMHYLIFSTCNNSMGKAFDAAFNYGVKRVYLFLLNWWDMQGLIQHSLHSPSDFTGFWNMPWVSYTFLIHSGN